MNLPLLMPCIAVFLLSPASAYDPEIGVAGMPDAKVTAQKRTPQAELSGFPAMPDVFTLDSLERTDEVAVHDETAKEKSRVIAERRRRAGADERFEMLMLLLRMLQEAQ